MSKRKKKPEKKPAGRGKPAKSAAAPEAKKDTGILTLYQHACTLAKDGKHADARRVYESLAATANEAAFKALVHNDLAVLAAVAGDATLARSELETALAADPQCLPARANLDLLMADDDSTTVAKVERQADTGNGPARQGSEAVRVAIVSFLFNWPSTGGGNVHTFELARYLVQAGYEVLHVYARFPAWSIGGVESRLPYPSEALEFDEGSWNVPAIQARFREAVDRFGPDHVILTDSWNMKPLLAEAVEAHPYILRFQGLECFCPLNNVRLLPEPGGRFRQCPLHQFANPRECTQCVAQRGHLSGSLHQAERALSSVGTPEYHERLLRVLREAEAVLVVNPLTEAMVSPYTPCVRVVTAGMDPARFPWPPEAGEAVPGKPLTLLFAGIVEEWMKGFQVLHEACTVLRQRRRDFVLVATGEPPGEVDAFTRFIGWQSQEELSRHLRACDILVMPTIAQEALGRTAVEAMAAGKPVVASRIGGLPFTVVDGATGLLCEPGDSVDLARKIELLLEDGELRRRLGLAGRRRFEEHYAWDVIIERHYRPLLKKKRTTEAQREQDIERNRTLVQAR